MADRSVPFPMTISDPERPDARNQFFRRILITWLGQPRHCICTMCRAVCQQQLSFLFEYLSETSTDFNDFC